MHTHTYTYIHTIIHTYKQTSLEGHHLVKPQEKCMDCLNKNPDETQIHTHDSISLWHSPN